MVTIKSEDGIIEGIELISDEHVVVGVQFHPKMFVNMPEYKNITDLFSNFLANC